MNIDTIENGYVLDHITAGKAMEIYDLLNLKDLKCQVALITNAKSKKIKTKDIIKIAELIEIDLDKLALIDPNITINVVKNCEIIEKKKLQLPERIVNVHKCNNPRCITSTERGLDQIFILTDKDKKIYRCMYCESSLNN